MGFNDGPDLGRNLGGYKTANREFLLLPGQPLQMYPKLVKVNGVDYQPAVISEEPVPEKKWGSIINNLTSYLGN
jgi:hypothetical protein